MSKRKRHAGFLLNDEVPDLHIKLKDRDAITPVHSEVLCLFSKLVRDMPKVPDGNPTIWDLSAVVLEGMSEPVTGATVDLWLDCVYSCVDSSRRFKLTSSNLEAARPLLHFADYAGSATIVFEKITSSLVDNPELCLTVLTDSEQGLSEDLVLRGYQYYFFSGDLYEVQLSSGNAESGRSVTMEEPCRQRFTSAVCSKLEEWLYLAGRLALVPLVELLLAFIKLQLFPGDCSIFAACIGSVYSPRVLQAIPTPVLLAGFLRDSLCHRPSDFNLTASDVKAEVKSAEAKKWFGDTADTKYQLRRRADGCSIIDLADENVECVLPVRVLVGGMTEEASAKVVQEVLSKVQDAD
ncbi:hypothetical protein Agub_g3366 [Astrephomene gubernaculifera]|uniref:Uncharacterized protein n=1 Tax=Astrephomene gubernaculifera TaxID=47775 RepID=A0AAD3DJQ7_9CHLO|nr:hypothetical protein Agub_g3366 [Astrephomene gubernaculifera]